MQPTRIAFYAPLKPPDHPIPSGDRQMARMLFSALKMAGYDAFLASRLISYSKKPDLELLQARKESAVAEADRLIAQWQNSGRAPNLWFCYHPYDKSPDWLGMEICDRLGIPMVTAEPCKTTQGDNGVWLPWRAEAQKGIVMAAMNIVLTPTDKNYLLEFVDSSRIVGMDPFIIPEMLEENDEAGDPWAENPDSVRLLAVGMMRPGKKTRCYDILAEALGQVKRTDWSLVIAGDGPSLDGVKERFEGKFGERIHFTGGLTTDAVIGLMGKADILAWPGYMEAFGMVYLEAASRGVPAVALDNLGTPLVVVHEKTGLLADPDVPGGYAAALTRLIGDSDLRKRLGEGARKFVHGERSGGIAARKLRTIIDGVLERATIAR